MTALRALYHLVRADFLERVRRYSFLVVLGVTLFLGYAVAAGHFRLRLDGFRGIYNSAWVGALTAMTTTFFVSLAGFYVVKNALERDRRTGVGQIIATTPVTRFSFMLGKMLSNLAVLAVIAGIMVFAAAATQLVCGEDTRIEPWPLVAPFLLVYSPAMATVAAMALLFETLPGLRGGLGNVLYFFQWLWLGTYSFTHPTPFADWMGYALIRTAMRAALAAVAPISDDGFLSLEASPAPTATPLQLFRWEGIPWTLEQVLARLYWIAVSFGLLLIATTIFNRFDPARGPSIRLHRRRRAAAQAAVRETRGSVPGTGHAGLARLGYAATRLRFGQTLLAELRLMLKGQQWWWYAVALGLVVASLRASANEMRHLWMPLSWIWPLLIWSEMGVREARHRTGQLVFSAAHPLRRQLPATWLAGTIAAALSGSGAAIRLVMSNDWAGIAAWVVGALFIPALSLALGTWSGNSKLFEVVYVIMWYLGPMEGMTALDFMGTRTRSIAAGMPWTYLGLTVLLCGLAVVGRRRQLNVR